MPKHGKQYRALAANVDKTIKLSRDKVCDLIPRGCVNQLQFAVIMEKLREFGKNRTGKG